MPSVGLKIRKRLPRSSMQMREYLPHMVTLSLLNEPSIFCYRNQKGIKQSDKNQIPEFL
jgi:hypothetical protein